MKNVSRNKCGLLCFRPVVDMDVMLEPRDVAVRRSANRHLRYIGVEENDGFKNSEKKLMILDNWSQKKPEDSTISEPPKRTLSRFIKAVVFETILKKTVRDKKRYRQDSFGSRGSSYSSNTERSSMDIDTQEIKHGSSSSCSSSVSESNKVSRCLSDEGKQNQSNLQDPAVKQRKIDRGCSGIYLLLISLTIRVLCGKLSGVFLTSIWLYIFSSRGYKVKLFLARRHHQIVKTSYTQQEDIKLSKNIGQKTLQEECHKGKIA
ncbi:putative Transmembrane protein [Quillaja saponaria]|uniref:Transmembrane protein n=1 Tax=Quillaja saponaria TaxID=32244 RepID=A0AAD7KYP1_QUISA|nr:putative Transmembrane protein [Quillaja saponaria]